MSQNVASVEKLNGLNNDRVRGILKEIFKYQNIIIYILTFMISTLSIKQEVAPFGLAMVAACVGESIPVIGVFIAALVGTAIGSGIKGLINFFVVSCVYFAFVLVFRNKIAIDERNEYIKTGGKLFTASLLISIIKSFIGMFLMYDVFMAIITSSLLYVFYKIFVNGLAFIKNFNIKSAYSIEELIAGIVIISLASVCLGSMNVFSINLSTILIIFVIMVLGWQNGPIMGAIAGIAAGLALTYVDSTNMVQITMFAVSGLISGIFNRFGKIGVIVGFILGNVAISYWIDGNASFVIYLREICIAAIGLLVLPKKIRIEVDELFGKDKLLAEGGERRLGGGFAAGEEISDKLKTLTNMFNDLMDRDSKFEVEKENLVQDFLDNIEPLQNNVFYIEISNEETGIAKDICNEIVEKDILTDKDLVEILKKHNNYVLMRDGTIKDDLQEIVMIANRTLKQSQISKVKKEEHSNTVKDVKENLKVVTEVIDKCADDISKNSENEFSNKEKEVLILLKNKNINVLNCNLKRLKNNKYIINLEFDYSNFKVRDKDIINKIAECLSKLLGTKIILQKEKIDDENKKYEQVYSSEDKFVLQVGSAKVTKDGSEISGDCSLQIKLADGKYLLAIADGMGTGEKARECSKLTIRLVKQLLGAGFESEESVKLINSRMKLLSNAERYSSLDMTILDLFVGKVETIKNAACSTYIKNKNGVRTVKSSGLPVGIVNQIDIKNEVFNVEDGDIIIMCSDGILESRDSEDDNWFIDLVKNINSNNVQKIADLVLAEAIDNNYGVARDDMTVIVSKIVKRK